jgi:hypothetical protein
MGSYMSGYGKVETKLLGIVKQKQMYLPYSDKWLNGRISPICENCGDNDYYNIYMSCIRIAGIIPLGKMDQTYKIICPKCSETVELEVGEFMLIQPFIELNSLLEKGKSDDFIYSERLEKVESRLLKIRRE